MQLHLLLRAATIAGALFCGAAAQAQVSPASGTVYLDAEPGNTVGYELDGITAWRHGVDGTMYTSDTLARANDGVNMFFQRGNDKWLMQFVAPLYNEETNTFDGAPLHVGLYDNVSGDWRNAPYQSGMLISSPLGIAWDWSGSFRVLEIGYGKDGFLSRFAVDFIQFDTLDQTGPALRGSLRYNSAIPIREIPEPATLGLALTGLGLMGATAWRRSRNAARRSS